MEEKWYIRWGQVNATFLSGKIWGSYTCGCDMCSVRGMRIKTEEENLLSIVRILLMELKKGKQNIEFLKVYSSFTDYSPDVDYIAGPSHMSCNV